jgi:hypothetical protein
MNLLEVKDILRNNLTGIEYKSRYLANNKYEASNLKTLRDSLNNVSSIDYIQPELESLKSTWLFDSYSDTIQIESPDDTKVSSLVSRIKIGLQFLLRVLENNNHSNKDDVVYIKLPEIKSFEELSRVSNDLKKGIEIPLREAEKGDVDILTAESGSIWLVVSVATASAVNLIAAICVAAAVIRKKHAEAKMFEQHAKTLELKNDALETFVSAQKLQINNILTNEAEAIANKHYDHKENETIERLKLSINTIADLIERGAKILPSSSNSETVKMFPDYNNLGLIESSIRQLTENK